MKDAVIVSAVRTPVGKAKRGGLATVRPDEMAATVIQELAQADAESRPRTDRGCGHRMRLP